MRGSRCQFVTGTLDTKTLKRSKFFCSNDFGGAMTRTTTTTAETAKMTRQQASVIIEMMLVDCGRCTLCRKMQDMERDVPQLRDALAVAAEALAESFRG